MCELCRTVIAQSALSQPLARDRTIVQRSFEEDSLIGVRDEVLAIVEGRP